MAIYIEIGRQDKKGIVSEIKSFTDQSGTHKTDKNGNFMHIVKIDNGDRGMCSTKDKEAIKWKVGTEVEYLIITSHPEDDPSKTSSYLSIKKTDSPYLKSGFKGRGAKDYKCDAVLTACTNAANTIAVRENLTDKDFPVYFKAYLNPMWVAIDQVYAD